MKRRLRDDAPLRLIVLLMPFAVMLNAIIWNSKIIFFAILSVTFLLCILISAREVKDKETVHRKRAVVKLAAYTVCLIICLIILNIYIFK